MTSTRRFAFVGSALAVTAVVAIGTIHQQRTSAVERARADQACQRAAALAALRQTEARTIAAEHERRALSAELKALEDTNPRTSPAPGSTSPKPIEVPSIAEQLQTNPAAQISALVHERAHVLATYGEFFRQLRLSPEQVAQFQDNVLRKKERLMDLQAIMRQQGLTHQDAAIQTLRQEGEAEYAAMQRGLLGSDAQRKLTDYERTSWLREMMIGWAGGAVVVAREPFTPDQAEQMVQILANASASYRRGLNAMTNDRPEYWSTVESEARKILSPVQFRYFMTTEPPLPIGARFQAEFYDKVGEALQKDAAEKKNAAPAKP